MTFLFPTILWGFAALPILALFYLLKIKPRQQDTGAFFLWQALMQERQARAWWQRLRELIGLLLLLLALSLLLFGGAGPHWQQDDGRDLLLILDSSASMASDAGSGSRLDQAKQQARALLAHLPAGRRAAIAAWDQNLRQELALGTDRERWHQALNRIHARPLPAQVRALADLPSMQQQLRIVLLSDGQFADALPADVDLVTIPANGDNQAIVTADLRRLPNNDLQLFVKLAGTDSEAVQRDLFLERIDGDQTEVLRIIPCSFPEVSAQPLSSLLTDGASGRYRLRLSGSDTLAWDDVAYLSVPPADPIRVLVRAEPAWFAKQAVRALGSQQHLMQLVDRAPELTLGIGVGADQSPAQLLFAPAGDGPWLELADPLPNPIAGRAAEGHPLFQHSDPLLLPTAGAQRLRAPDQATVLLWEQGGTPLVYVHRDGEHDSLVVNTDPRLDGYLSPQFPVLVHNAARYLCARPPAPPAAIASGQPLPLPKQTNRAPSGTHGFNRIGRRPVFGSYVEGQAPLTPESHAGNNFVLKKKFRREILDSSQLYHPTGQVETLQADRRVLADHLGWYRWQQADRHVNMAVNLFSPVDSQQSRSHQQADTINTLPQGWPPAIWFLLTALLLLVTESLLYIRRLVA